MQTNIQTDRRSVRNVQLFLERYSTYRMK